MSISFTSSIIGRLKKEIAELQKQRDNDKSKRDKALAKARQLQKSANAGSPNSDQSDKIVQAAKLNKEAARLEELREAAAKQLTAKNAELRLLLAKAEKRDGSN